MTLDELKSALLLVAKSEDTTEITSVSEVDIERIRGVTLIDNKFVDFFKGNIIKIDIDLDSEQITLGYRFLEKDTYYNKWIKRIRYQIIPFDLITKIYVLMERTDFVGANIPFGLRLERNSPYYLSGPKILSIIASMAQNDNKSGDATGDEETDIEEERDPPTEINIVGSIYATVGTAEVY